MRQLFQNDRLNFLLMIVASIVGATLLGLFYEFDGDRQEVSLHVLKHFNPNNMAH